MLSIQDEIFRKKSGLLKKRNYSKYPFKNLSLKSIEGEEWEDIQQFDGCYNISNYGRIRASPRPVNTITGQSYYTKERIRKQTLGKEYNSYTKDYTEQLSIRLRYGGKSFGFKVCRLVYEFFVAAPGTSMNGLLVVHKDGDNCNNRYDNLVLMNGTELYGHGLKLKRRPRTGLVMKKGKRSPSDKNAPRAVIKYSLDGKKLKEYESVKEAAQDNNTTRGSIGRTARQKLVTLYGFVYRFKDTPYHGERADFSTEKKVTQYSLSGKKIRTYPSVKMAATKLGYDPDMIRKSARKKTKLCGGFVWRYEGDTYSGEFEGTFRNQPRGIVQYRLDGKQIAGFASANEAKLVTGFPASVLLDCANGKTKVSHGFVWRFAGIPYSGEYKEYRKGKPVTQHSLEGKRIGTYPTIEAAARATGLTPDNIQKNVSGHNRTAGGFVWKYATPEEIKRLPPFVAKQDSAKRSTKQVIQYSFDGKKLALTPASHRPQKYWAYQLRGFPL